jgi:hypothetical protein
MATVATAAQTGTNHFQFRWNQLSVWAPPAWDAALRGGAEGIGPADRG